MSPHRRRAGSTYWPSWNVSQPADACVSLRSDIENCQQQGLCWVKDWVRIWPFEHHKYEVRYLSPPSSIVFERRQTSLQPIFPKQSVFFFNSRGFTDLGIQICRFCFKKRRRLLSLCFFLCVLILPAAADHFNNTGGSTGSSHRPWSNRERAGL